MARKKNFDMERLPNTTKKSLLATLEEQDNNNYDSLDACERIIKKGLKSFLEVGKALVSIRDKALYKHEFKTFEDYCRSRWDFSRPRAYQFIDASGVVENLVSVSEILPQSESQARPLSRLDPSKQQEVWREVVEEAIETHLPITAKLVNKYVKKALPENAESRAVPKAGTFKEAANKHSGVFVIVTGTWLMETGLEEAFKEAMGDDNMIVDHQMRLQLSWAQAKQLGLL